MRIPTNRLLLLLAVAAISMMTSAPLLSDQGGASGLIYPDELVTILKSAKGEKPLLIQVGFHVLYAQAHIPGSEYIGPASSGLQQLRKRVSSFPRSKFIVIYCGCCPWDHCPNVKPAAEALRALGFTNVRILYFSDNFGANWVEKGYPVAKGE